MVLDKITAEVVLLVEGADDQQIVAALLDQLKPDWKSLIDIQAKAQYGGLVQGARALAVVSGFDRVKTVAVLVDADETPEKTDASCRQLILKVLWRLFSCSRWPKRMGSFSASNN